MIFLAGLGLTASVISLLYLSQHLIASKSNEIDQQRSVLSVEGAVQTSVNRVLSLVLDNAIWDDAVTQTYAPSLDQKWLYDSWGSGFKINNLYDGTFVLDEHYRILWGAFQSQVLPRTDLSFLGSGLTSLIRSHAQALREGKNAFAGITRTEAGIAFVGIGLIRPTTGRLQVFDATRRYLVITRHINPQLLERLGDTFQIRHLHLAEGPGAYRIPLRTQADEVLEYLAWQPRLPGAEAAQASSGSMGLIAGVAASLILLFILFSSLGMYKLARGERQAREIAMIDWLSRLPNRRALLLRLSQVCETGKHDIQCVVFIDLDGFKDVNDNYGHDVGDALIRHIASALQTRVPTGAMLARMGGDEFAMAVSGAKAIDRAAAFAWAALELLKAPVTLSKRKIYIGASIGIASGAPVECSSTELFRRADIAMYHAKKSGKGRTAWYDDALDAVRRHQLMIENGIRQGLEQDEFEVWYQPVDDLLLSVNISPAQFRDPAFENRVMKTVAACRFPPSRLQVEVTESYVLENPERSQAVVENLKAQGIAVALDDFGTGYSSIGYLRRFRFDSLKIDKSLAGRVDSDEQAAEMVRGTVRIARALGMTVVAEGVEDLQQLTLLRRAGCDRLQGYYFSKPMPIADLLQRRQSQG